MSVVIDGVYDPNYEGVARAFAEAFIGNEGMGGSLCVYRSGRPVLDLWGGTADIRSGRAWDKDTISVIFSCTKGLMSILVARLVEEGRLDYDAPAARYWPEIAGAGKASLKVSDLVSHRAGLSAPRVDLSTEDLLDWERMIHVLEAQPPLWPPGEAYAYHALTHGWLTGELVRRATGLSAGAYSAETVARPLGVSAWIGLPATEVPRVAHLHGGPTMASDVEAGRATWTGEGGIWLERAMTMGGALPLALIGPGTGFNDPRLWAAEIPGAGALSNARSLARIWSATVCDTDGERLLQPETVALATREITSGAPVFNVPPPWSSWGMGFQRDSEARRYLSARSFGHDGAGGQVTFADPDHEIGFAFVTNHMEVANDNRATSIIAALSEALGITARRAAVAD